MHTTICIANSSDEPKQSNVCDVCFEASNPSQAYELTSALKAGCRYCGGPPYSGGGHSPDGLSGSMKLSFMCKACAEEYFRFLRQKLPNFGSPDITKEQIAEIRKNNMGDVLAELEGHMKKWVADRGPR